MPEIKAIIFDYDGVIVDSAKTFMDVFNSLAKKYGYKQVSNKDEFTKIYDRNLFEPETSLGLTKLKTPMYLKELKKNLKDNNKKVKAYTGIGQLMTILSEHFKLALVSTNFKEAVAEVLSKEKIKDKFSAIVIEEGQTIPKMIRKCLEQMELRPNDVVFVSDTFGSIMLGKEAHVKTIAITWGYQLRPKLLTASPDFIVDKPSELMEALNVIIQE